MTKIAISSAMAINIFANDLKMRRAEAARRYAAADRSDPFAFSRAMSHHSFGLCGSIVVKENGKSVAKSGHYDADTFPCRREIDPRLLPLMAHPLANKQMRLVDGTQFKSVVRP